jgi:hypothetical protein
MWFCRVISKRTQVLELWEEKHLVAQRDIHAMWRGACHVCHWLGSLVVVIQRLCTTEAREAGIKEQARQARGNKDNEVIGGRDTQERGRHEASERQARGKSERQARGKRETRERQEREASERQGRGKREATMS